MKSFLKFLASFFVASAMPMAAAASDHVFQPSEVSKAAGYSIAAPARASVDWTGPYVGGSIGLAEARWPNGSSSSLSGNLFAGFNLDMGDIVIGADAVFMPASVFGDFTTAGGQELRSAWALMGSVGAKIDDEGRTLVSAGIGPQWVRTRDAAGITTTSTGVGVGVGVERLVDENWSVRSGLLHQRFNRVGVTQERVNTYSAYVGAAFRF